MSYSEFRSNSAGPVCACRFGRSVSAVLKFPPKSSVIMESLGVVVSSEESEEETRKADVSRLPAQRTDETHAKTSTFKLSYSRR